MRSLFVRLFAVSVVVSVFSIAATAWLAVRTTTRAIQHEQSRALTDDARIYDTLLGWAAAHHAWDGVVPLARDLASGSGRRVVLTTVDRRVIVDSATGPLPSQPSATVDPLHDLNRQIDARAVGPFLLPTAERTRLRSLADLLVTCLTTAQPAAAPKTPGPVAAEEPRVVDDARIITGPSGRPRVETPGRDDPAVCVRPRLALAEPTATELKAMHQLDGLVRKCLAPLRLPAVRTTVDGTWAWADTAAVRVGAGQDAEVDRCLTSARRAQLTAYVAPPALLFLTEPGPEPTPGLNLDAANRWRIVGVSALVLLVAVGASALVGLRLVRPMRALAGAARRMRDGDPTARVRVTGNDEIARLGAAFNDMAATRQDIEQLRRDMVGDIAHEMRTPVTNIRGWLEAAEDGVVVLDRALVSSLLEEAQLLQHVLDDLRDLAAADAGELRLHPSRVDLPDLLAQVAAAHRTAAVGVSVAGPEPLVIEADPFRLRQAVGNLVSNAVRHSPAGSTVVVSVRVSPDILIDVTDQGPGVSAEDLPRVFERFWRSEKSRNRQTGGSGLGLSISRKIAEAHGGTVSVTSTPGAGATFTLHLPA